MIHRTIQDVDVPALGFGTWQLRGAACRAGVAHALDIGYRHIDTAEMYGNEADVGRGLQDAGVDRDDVFLTTKVWHTNLQPEAVRASAEDSLRKLQTEYVDLLLIHWPNESVPLEATLDALRALQTAGKTRHIGVSNFPSALMRRALDHTPLLCNQVEYHPFLAQNRLLEMARTHGFLLTAYSPLAKGRVLRDGTLQAIGEKHDRSPAQIVLRWLLQQEPVAAIPKAARRTHREANVDVFDFTLTDEEMAHVHDLARGIRGTNPSFAPAWRS